MAGGYGREAQPRGACWEVSRVGARSGGGGGASLLGLGLGLGLELELELGLGLGIGLGLGLRLGFCGPGIHACDWLQHPL